MTLEQAIQRGDELRAGNPYTREMKIEWLSTVDSLIYQTVCQTHAVKEGFTPESFEGYDTDTAATTELIAKSPYDDLYAFYIAAMVDYNNGEINKYNSSVAAYNDRLQSFKNYYNRNVQPLQPNSIKL